MANIDYFILSEVPGLREYSPDIGRLKASPVTVVPAGGIDSQGCLPYRYAEALADHLKTKVVDFPGNHVGCVLYPEEFAERLDMVLEDVTTKIPRDETLGIFNRSAVRRKLMACNRHSIFQFNCIRSLML